MSSAYRKSSSQNPPISSKRARGTSSAAPEPQAISYGGPVGGALRRGRPREAEEVLQVPGGVDAAPRQQDDALDGADVGRRVRRATSAASQPGSGTLS